MRACVRLLSKLSQFSHGTHANLKSVKMSNPSFSMRKGAPPLAEVAMHVLATFLDSAMPIRNFFLWARPTEEIKEKRASDSLGQRHDKG